MARPMMSLRQVTDVLAAARAPLTVPEISEAARLSQVQVRRAVRRLREVAAVCFGDPVRRDRCGRCHYQYVLCEGYAPQDPEQAARG